jgi:molybdopterin converting factor small subunit
MVKVHVASVLFEYTGDAPEVEANGGTLRALLLDLDKRHPGLRFRVLDEQDRVRQHMNVFIAGRPTRSLETKIGAGEEVHILQALSGG